MPRRKRSSWISQSSPLTFSTFSRHQAFGLGGKRRCGGKKRGSDSSSDDDGEGKVQADFAFYDPKPDDFHGVKALLMNYLDNMNWDVSGFVDLILGQTTVGTVVKSEDSDPFSVSSVLNFGRYKDHSCIMELKDFLQKNCPDKVVLNDLKHRLGKDAHNHGLIVSQRVVNLPYQLLPHLYDALFDEISWAMEDEPTEELRNSFHFKSYIIISKIYKHKSAMNACLTNETDETLEYVKFEDEIFLKLSSWHFCFPLHNDQAKANKIKNFRAMGVVMAVEADKIPHFRTQLHSLIDEC